MYPFNLLIGPFHITNYDLFNFLGLVFLFILMVAFVEKKAPFSRRQIAVGCIVGIITGTTGAKLTHLLLYAENYRGMSPEKVLFAAGHAFIGGAVISLVAVYILFRYYKVSFFYVADYLLPFFGLMRATGRIGCLLTGCCHGSVSALPWACFFGDGLLRHPTQAYMLILTLSIFIAGRLSYRRLMARAGIIFFSSIIMYGLGRFFVEFFRVDSPYVIGYLKLSHTTLVVISVFGLAGLFVLYRRHRRQTAILSLIIWYFGRFAISMVVMSAVVLTILSFLPKLNHKDVIDLRIGKGGIGKIEAKSEIDYRLIEKIKRALEVYKRDNGSYPTQEQGLKALIEKPTARPMPINWNGPYIDNRLLLSEDTRPYKYQLDRYGDKWSYRITVPFKEKGPSAPVEEERGYVLEVEVHHALALYKLDNGIYPTQGQGLNALIEKPGISPVPQNWQGPYLKGPLKNRSGKSYRYKIEERGGEVRYFIYTE